MEFYNVTEREHEDAYMIQAMDPNLQMSNPLLQNFEAMYNERAPEFVIDQGLYYPTATNYSYLGTGFESPNNWDDHQRVFGLDDQDIPYTGAHVVYTPDVGYAESLYNPYNPYIPGAFVGVDGSYVEAQQYYTIPFYENTGSSPSCFPVVVPSASGIAANSAGQMFSSAYRADDTFLNHTLSPASPTFTPAPLGPALGHNRSGNMASGSAKTYTGSNSQLVTHGNVTSVGVSTTSSQVNSGKVSQAIGSTIHKKAMSSHQPKAPLPTGNDLSNFGSGAHEWAGTGKVRPKFLYGSSQNDVQVSRGALTEQNQGPKNNKTKNQLVVKAYTTRAGNVDAQGNIVIHADEYSKDDFPPGIMNAKFFVIKSYSEDDVHKSVKYNVWSSTPNGNKKLSSAYEDAQRVAAGDPRGCPIFLFFSVNASGQFCGVAEMTGPVDFYKDMDFWQQDKWSGSFPVKWHIIKDVPNPNFRHIILENNENKPVTNSRDTQEIYYRKGIEVLKVFKEYASRTSLLDDFMYYEKRQKILQEEKAKLLIRSYESPFLVPVVDPPRKLNSVFDLPSGEGEKILEHSVCQQSEDCKSVPAELDALNSKANKDSAIVGEKVAPDGDLIIDTVVKIGSLTINPKQSKPQPLEAVRSTGITVGSTKLVDVVTVGSMPVKVNGFSKSSGFLTIGTIPLDPRAFQRDEASGSGNIGP